MRSKNHWWDESENSVGKGPKSPADDLYKFRKQYANARYQGLKPINMWFDENDSCCLQFPKCLEHSFIKSNDNTHENVFIDSYYPKILGDFEECRRKSCSSRDESQKFWLHDASESDSKKTYDAMKNIYTRAKPKFMSVVFNNSGTGECDQAKLKKSSKSRLTLNCKTYTLISLSSDLESLASISNLNTYEKVTEESSRCSDEDWSKEDKAKNSMDSAKENHKVFKTTDCFAHLFERIETLEELLKQTLANSNQTLEWKYSEKSDTKQSVEPVKSKFVLPKAFEFKNHSTSGLKMKEEWSAAETTDEKENSDTEDELQNIKQRLNALEKRFKTARNSVAFRSEATELPIKDSLLNDSYSRRPKEDDFSKKVLSQTTFVVPSEFFIFNTKPEDKRKKVTISKRVKRKTSNTFNSRRKTFRSKKFLKITNDKNKLQGKLKEISSQSRSVSKTFQNTTEKQEEEKTLAFHAIKKPNKKHRNKGNNLCKKTSFTNMVLGQGDQTKEKEMVNPNDGPTYLKRNSWILTPSKRRTNFRSPCSCWMTFSARYPQKPRYNSLFKKKFSFNDELEKIKTIESHSSIADPIEILKDGGKIRIPVLFEEVCKRSSSKVIGHNLSDISMRFVLVQEDPKYPLRKLIKKLARNSSKKTEHYLFGVSKCSCNTQVEPQL